MLQVGDRVRVKAQDGGPDVSLVRSRYRLQLVGLTGTVTAVLPNFDRPIVVGFVDPAVPPLVRFWGYDLLEVA